MIEHQFVLMWDMYGLEYCEDLTAANQQVVWDKLRDPESQSRARIPNLLHLELRARYNSHRHYEIWTVFADPGITKTDIVRMFEENPQGAAELVRAHGHCFHDDRPQGEIKII